MVDLRIRPRHDRDGQAGGGQARSRIEQRARRRREGARRDRTPGGSKDPNKWPADDRSMCDFRNKPDLEVSETMGPGALRPNIRRVYKTYGEGETTHKTLICREVDTNLDGIKDVVRTFNAKGEA